jgi:vacuolar-type H+-ATPase subunit H
MTDNYSTAGTTESGSGSGGAADTAKQAASTAKEQAGQVGQQAAQNAKQVAGTAKEEATKVASEAKQQAKQLYTESMSQLSEQAGTQQARVASGLRSVSDELTSMANNSDQQGIASELVSTVASRAGSVASWLDGRDPAAVLDEVKRFARRRPGAFIGFAAIAGVVAGRLVRNLAAEAKDEKEAEAALGAGSASTGTPVTTLPPVPPVTEVPAYPYTSAGTLGTPSTLGADGTLGAPGTTYPEAGRP